MRFKKTSPLVRVIDGALPDALVTRARRAIARLGSERLRESYFTTFWLARAALPANVIEECVLALARKVRSKCAGYEWWIGRAYAHRMPIEFHFDHDVKGGSVRNPLVSTVFFFNSVRGGRLAVTDQTLSNIEADRLETVKPRRNRYAIFRGNLFHGVLAGPRGRLRITLVVNFWARRPTEVPTWSESGVYRGL
ncbi:MAG: 2OG-Fe(II) oxygenase [Myxococcales bacterium]|nr:2OG-Fe(II) oxygenase [Myxococcales bacterium]